MDHCECTYFIFTGTTHKFVVRLNWPSSFYKLSPRRLPLNSCPLDVDYRRTVGVVAVAGT
jgi:hypothetical protein